MPLPTELEAPRLRQKARADRHTVAVYAFDGMSPFELGCVVEVFGLPRPELDVPWYELKVCAESAAPLRAVGGFTLATECGMDEFVAADTVIVPAVADVRGEVSAGLVRALRSAHERGARVVSICSGVFALAAAGLLDGREATTHWQYASLLAERFPQVRVNPDVLYVDNGRVLTSAGSAAGLDLCLHLVRLDHGSTIANSVARRLVLPPHREGGQAQFIEAAVRPVGEDDAVARSLEWALAHLAEPIAIADLAGVARMSTRSYLRHFARATGTTPLRWLVSQRIAAARPLLEGTDAPVEQVGAAVGFADAATFRHHFTRSVGTSPSAYRRTFRQVAESRVTAPPAASSRHAPAAKIGPMAERDWDEIAEGVFRKRFEPCDVTVTAVLGSDGVAVVDTRCSLAEAREIKAQLGRLTSAPVRWVVNTHAHFDHCWGNAEFVAPRLTPSARIWGHASVPARLDPQDPEVREWVARLAAEGPQWAERMAELELRAPAELVHDQASIDLGDRSLELRFLGRGHTDGDLWILVDAGSTRVVLAGDLVEQSGPPAFGPDSFPLEWADTLDRAMALIGLGTLVVPGHGAVVDAAFVREQRDAIASVAQEIRRLHAAGVPVESAAQEGAWAIEAKALGSAIERGYFALA